MQLLKLLVVILAFSLVQADTDVGLVQIPPNLSWVKCSDHRTTMIDFNVQLLVALALLNKNATAVVQGGELHSGTMSSYVYLTDDGFVDTLVIRKKNIDQYYALNDFVYYQALSCVKYSEKMCARHTTEKNQLDYDYQCLVIANANSFTVNVTISLSFDMSQSGNDAVTLSGKIIQIILFGFIVVLAGSIL